ncbi:transcriptional repressor [Mycobacterium phage SirPhilip]|uniref:Immunity repressor n=1 Tax=Mycobacterium phage SirPhilip TaxID=2015824 RepID=A0A222ZKK7_9CAUD|nr:transcriptional repressor [Mycobacterium phage SirPhilip]ASR85247.1 immunity repressor [Mycobacterium phage SirPhilip]
MDDSDKSLSAVLGYLVGRPLKLREILEALQMSRSRYYAQMDEGRLTSADNLVRAANNLGINEVDLLARFNVIRTEAVLEYADMLRGGQAQAPLAPSRRASLSTATSSPEAPARKGRRKVGELSVRRGVASL